LLSSDIPIKYQGVTEEKSVTIGDGCWICSRVIILPGVHIGKNSVIGAGSVVTKDIPDYAIAAGNPAKVVRIRDGVHKDNAY
jgi:maltose O-acetyltransferase